MKLLGFRDSPGIAASRSSERSPTAGLFREDPERFARWIEYLTSEDPRLKDWGAPLRSGKAIVVLTGQQPALLGGPLYTLYKTLTAVETARRLRAQGMPAIAAFWCVGDDTDTGEVAWASWPVRDAPPRRVRDEGAPRGERIGSLPAARMEEALRLLHEDWPMHAIPQAGPPSEDWSTFLRRSLRFLCGDEPLLFVDGNDPETIRTSQPWLRTFLNRRGELADGIAQVAAVVKRTGLDPPIGGEEASRCLFIVDGRSRRVLGPQEGTVGPDGLLLPNVVLRPALQEHLLPIHRVVCGEGEIAYRQLLGPVYALAGMSPAPWSLRFSATLFPPGWVGVREKPDPAQTLERTTDTIDAMARGSIDTALLEEVRGTQERVLGSLMALADPLAKVDRSLPQLLESVTSKVDFQLRRIEEAVLTKARAALLRRYPVLANLRETLSPRGRPQERAFSLWTPYMIEGMGAIRDLERAIEDWFARGESGHALLALDEEGERPVGGRREEDR